MLLNKYSDRICPLGAIHTEKSFIGSIVHITNDSGDKKVLTEVYAEKSVSHMFAGRIVSRAI